MSDVLKLETRSRKLVFRGHTITCRSETPFRFLVLLWWKSRRYPESPWVDLPLLSRHLGASIHPRQMQRTLGWFDAIDAVLFFCQTKTRGPYRLAYPPEKIELDLTEEQVKHWLGLPHHSLPHTGFLQGKELLNTVNSFLGADTAFFNGHLDQGEDSALALLARNIPPPVLQWQSPWLLRKAGIELQLGRESHAEELIGQVRDLHGDRISDPELSVQRLRAGLIEADLALERSGASLARDLLQRNDIQSCQDGWTLGRYHATSGHAEMLIWHERLKTLDDYSETNKTEVFSTIEKMLERAMAYHLQVLDYPALLKTCVTMSQLYATPALFRIEPADSRRLAMIALGWLGAATTIARNFHLSHCSVRPYLLALRLAVTCQLSMDQINDKTSGLFSGSKTLRQGVEWALAKAQLAGRHRDIQEAERLKQHFAGAV